MARIPLSTRAERLRERLRGRPSDQPLPKSVRTEQDRFARSIGYDPDKFNSLKPATKRRYINAARKGQNASEYRRSQYEKRRMRDATRQTRVQSSQLVTSDARWARVQYLVTELKAEGMVVVAGEHTLTDSLDYEDLYSDASLQEHIIVYGWDYVLARLEHQYRAIRQYNTSGGLNRSIGREEMLRTFGTTVQRDFRATAYNFADDDERWYWYHATSYFVGSGY